MTRIAHLPPDSLQLGASYRDDVMNPADVAALGMHRASLLTDGSEKARRLVQLPAIRLRGIVLWQRSTQVGGLPAAPVWPGKVPS